MSARARANIKVVLPLELGIGWGARPIGLTEREWAVARGLASDQPIKEIASELGVSPKTVEYYWARIKAKVGVRSHVGLLRWMVERGLLRFPGARSMDTEL
jgi:DNA-binding NarL/FixJ family response regulator